MVYLTRSLQPMLRPTWSLSLKVSSLSPDVASALRFRRLISHSPSIRALPRQFMLPCVSILLRPYPRDAPLRPMPPPIAFHWTGHDGTSAITEIARVLKPGGVAVFIWNLEDREQAWVAKLRDLYEVYEDGEPVSALGIALKVESLLNPPML